MTSARLFQILDSMAGLAMQARREPSPANLRAAKRIIEHRARNWPNAGPWPPVKYGPLPVLRKGGGQREVGA